MDKTDLFKYQDLKYKDFNDKIINSNFYPTIGIRIPVLRKLAREIVLNDYKSYLNAEHKYYEEYMLHGLVIGYAKISFEDTINYLYKYIPTIKDWASVDIPVSNLKIFKKHLKEGYPFILDIIKKDTFHIRFGLVLLLNYYINDDYLDKIFKIILTIQNDDYYVIMAKAWLLSYCYMKYPNETYKYLKENDLDINVLRKTISKVCDSYRVSKENKELIKQLRR